MAQQRKHGRRAILLLAASIGLLSFASSTTEAQTPAGQRAGNRASTPAFTFRDDKIIREYFAAYSGETGLMPAEIPVAQPVRGQRLRPASDRRPLPRNLAVRLKPLPKGYERIIIDNDVLIVTTKTGAIADVLLDAW